MRAEVVAQAVLTVLRARGLEVPSTVRERILIQRDQQQLDRWLEKAAVAPWVGAVFDETRTQDLMMKGYEYQNDLAEDPVAQGHLEGTASALLTVLEARGFAVPDAIREQILAQKDLKQLERWLEKAVRSSSVASVFDEPN